MYEIRTEYKRGMPAQLQFIPRLCKMISFCGETLPRNTIRKIPESSRSKKKKGIKFGI